MKNLAFTLAETLIVIAIIGVVAALTLPNLNSSTGDRERVTKVKKIYASLNEATSRAVAIYGPIDEWFAGSVEDDEIGAMYEKFINRLSEFLKASKIELNAYNSKIYLSDGMVIKIDDSIVSSSKFCDKSINYLREVVCFEIKADIDGDKKGKNKESDDIFAFDVMASGSVYPSAENSSSEQSLMPCLGPAYCTAWVIEMGNVDYLKATKNDDGTYTCPDGENLNWETKTSCN